MSFYRFHFNAGLALFALSLFAPPAHASCTKICEGKYKTSTGGETIISLQCNSVSDPCFCSSTTVLCGSKSTRVSGMTFVAGSCKATYVPSGQTVCPQIFDPVTCSNGETYANSCYADAACAQECVPLD